MPTYIYRASGEESCRYCAYQFERRQRISDPRLQCCPECGAPVRQVLTPPNLATPVANISTDNIEKKGFTQYRKVEKGVYEKTAGKGPKLISDK
jgi:putative FmdB family regulatory protein